MKPARFLIISAFIFTAAFVNPAALSAAGIEEAVLSVKQDIQTRSRELNAAREEITRERSALAQEARGLESETARLREKALSLRHAKWYRDAGFDQLKEETDILGQEVDYISSLIADMRRSMIKRAHASEEQRFAAELEKIDSLIDEPGRGSALRALEPLLSVIERRNAENYGGHIYQGKAADEAGVLHEGTYVLAGPLAYFTAKDNKPSGLAQAALGSAYPAVTYHVSGDDLKKIAAGEEKNIPFDATGGEAVKLAAREETLWEHIAAGGIIMIPILILGALSLGVAISKMLFLRRIRPGVEDALPVIFSNIGEGRIDEAAAKAKRLGAPWGPVLAEGVYHHNISMEHLEEILHEKTLAQIPYLERNLSLLAVAAAASPLLGLLGTVTGMIHTFDLVTIFGTGKANLLSGGISEALITTEFGLIVAIPALLAHAFLSRRVQKILHRMEQVNTSFVNGLKMIRFKNFAREERF